MQDLVKLSWTKDSLFSSLYNSTFNSPASLGQPVYVGYARITVRQLLPTFLSHTNELSFLHFGTPSIWNFLWT